MAPRKYGLTSLIAAAALAMPLAVGASSASASTTSNGCTVTPLKPEFHNQWTTSGEKRIQYKVKVSCNANLLVTITQERYEADTTSADDHYGTTTLTNSFDSAGSVTRTVTATLPDGDPWGDDNEEMYQRVQFKVTGLLDGVTSPTTAWESSPTATFHL